MYFKILRENLKHYDMQYKEGLNVDVLPFNPKPECGEGGLYFTDEQYILDFVDYGSKIAEVTVPEGEMIVPLEEKYKAHKIILSNIRDLWTVETFEYLVSKGVNLHADYFVLRCAAEKGHLDVVRHLIEQGANDYVYKNVALRGAAGKGHLEIVKYLVEQRADIHAVNDYALRWAAFNGNLEVVKYLIEQGADVHAADDYALRWAAVKGHGKGSFGSC